MDDILQKFDLSGEQSGAGSGSALLCGGEMHESVSPIDGRVIGRVRCANEDDYEHVMLRARHAFEQWRIVPAPKRGELVRKLGYAFREHKKELAALISLEMGKVLAEAEGEVQEVIDMADLAAGQSRMLYGLAMHSERPGHRMFEQWHPLGPVGVVTAFNFPVAVWAWNAMLSLIAGDTVVWKPSSKVPLTAIAVMKIAWGVLSENGLPEGVLNLLIGPGGTIGEALVCDSRIPLLSFTGSVETGRRAASEVAARLGRTILELGGNNGAIVTPGADLDLAVKAVLFSAVGTSGQRCTTMRRIIVHQTVYNAFVKSLISAYKQVSIGNPLDAGTLMGPLVDREAADTMQAALLTIEKQGGRILYGGDMLLGEGYESGAYVTPCLAEVPADVPIVREETFAPILYVMRYTSLEEAIRCHNEVPQGLSSAIFTHDLKEAELFLSQKGSDCGIACVNMGTSGAEIGGAFGGEKDTGGGREAGSDAWKAYMRRQTCTINWSGELALAQGVRFGAT
ncbi:MAG TPA: aldehyde dehydrogenase family protein [Syntrophorhabdaceae bacterium]